MISLSPEIRRQSLIAGLLAFLVFIAGVYGQAPIGFDSRFVLFAQEMLRHGPTVFPTTYDQPYADYSAVSTLFIWLLSLPFGAVNAFTAWAPSAGAGALIVTLMYRLLAPYSRRWALIFALLLLGFGIRGPIGLVVPTGMLCSYYLLNREWTRLLVFGVLASLLLAVCVGLLLWLAKLSGGPVFLQDVIRMQFMGRMDGSEGVSGSLYYFTSSFGNYALAYPLALLVLVAAWLSKPQQRGPALRLVQYCAAAGMIVMVGLSIPQAKKARYLLPMLPMAAIIAAYPFQVAHGRVFRWLRGLMLGVWLVTPGLLMVVLLVARRRFPEQLSEVSLVLIVLGLLQLLALSRLLIPRWRVEVLALSAVLALWTVYAAVFEPVERRLYDTQGFSHAVFAQVQQNPAPLVLHGMGKDAKAIKFMVNIEQDLQPQFSDSIQQLEALKGPAWLMMDRSDFLALRGTPLCELQPILSGRFDKNDYVLLYANPL